MTPIKLFHISDLHIGMKFNHYPEDVREQLIDARFSSLGSAIQKANEAQCDFFIITGDLFDSLRVKKKDLEKTQQILKAFSGEAVILLPGNHDHWDTESDFWKNFEDTNDDHCIIVKDQTPYVFEVKDQTLCFLPAPCHKKHSSENGLDWIKASSFNDQHINIVLAHGALKELSPDLYNNYYPMTLDELNALSADLCLVGHTHVPYPLEDEVTRHKVFNAGTLEPDGMNYKYEGSGWLIEVAKDKPIQAKRLVLGQYRFIDTTLVLDQRKDKNQILETFKDINLQKALVRLHIKGRLKHEDYENQKQILNTLFDAFFYLDIHQDQLQVQFSPQIIEQHFSKHSLPHTVLTRLLEETDQETTHYAFELMNEVMDHD